MTRNRDTLQTIHEPDRNGVSGLGVKYFHYKRVVVVVVNKQREEEKEG